MVLPIAHNDIAPRHDRYPLQPLELPVSRAPGPEGAEEGAVRVEDLDTVIARVSYHDVALVVYGYASEIKKTGHREILKTSDSFGKLS